MGVKQEPQPIQHINISVYIWMYMCIYVCMREYVVVCTYVRVCVCECASATPLSGDPLQTCVQHVGA